MQKVIYMSLVLNLFQTSKFNKKSSFLKNSSFLRSSVPTIPKNTLALKSREEEGKTEKETTARGFINYSSLHIQLHLKSHNQNHSILGLLGSLEKTSPTSLLYTQVKCSSKITRSYYKLLAVILKFSCRCNVASLSIYVSSVTEGI